MKHFTFCFTFCFTLFQIIGLKFEYFPKLPPAVFPPSFLHIARRLSAALELHAPSNLKLKNLKKIQKNKFEFKILKIYISFFQIFKFKRQAEDLTSRRSACADRANSSSAQQTWFPITACTLTFCGPSGNQWERNKKTIQKLKYVAFHEVSLKRTEGEAKIRGVEPCLAYCPSRAPRQNSPKVASWNGSDVCS